MPTIQLERLAMISESQSNHIATQFDYLKSDMVVDEMRDLQNILDLLEKHDEFNGSIRGSSIDSCVPLTDEKL